MAGLDGGGRKLAGVSGEPEEGAEYLGTADEDPGIGGCQPKGIGGIFQGGGTFGASFWVRDVGADPPHGTGPGKISTRGSKADNREKAEEMGGRGLVIPTTGGSGGGGGI